jgi:hypothetical protein
MADDELAIPQVPEPKPEDVEDVSWALSTAEAMWARGDHMEGIKWVRKAAEAASDAEDDLRSLQLAKAAAELAAMIARRSVSDPPSSARTMPGGPPSSQQPATSRTPSGQVAPPVPQRAAPPPPAPAAKSGRSMPPAPVPLPSRSVPPAAPVAPPAPASSQRAAPRPLATGAKTQGPASGRGVLSNRPPAMDSKRPGRRKSKDNLEAEARAAGVLDTAPQTVLDDGAAQKVLGKTDEMPAIGAAPKRRRQSEPEPADLVPDREKSADEWDSSPTQNLAGGDFVPSEGDRKTSITTVAQRPAAVEHPRAPSVAPHDPGIQTTQAVRVVVWRDANGVHVAPAGTVVSAIKIDAVLVALEPNADLTAWLTQRDR